MPKTHQLAQHHLDSLPVFPLPGLVFFPNTGLPLHIFEPRYRDMTRFCVDEQWPMAVVRIRPGGQTDAAGRPLVEATATAGLIVGQEEMADGRFNILLAGVERVRLIEELDCGGDFRRFRAEVIPDEVADPDAMAEKVQTLKGCLMSLQQTLQRHDDVNALDAELLKLDNPAVLTNALAAPLMPDADDRQRMLECADVGERLETIIDRVAEVIAMTTDAGMMH